MIADGCDGRSSFEVEDEVEGVEDEEEGEGKANAAKKGEGGEEEIVAVGVEIEFKSEVEEVLVVRVFPPSAVDESGLRVGEGTSLE